MDPRIQVVYDQSHGRVPLIALDYSQRHLRQFRELMVDYTNGNLYVVSATDRDIIFSVTETIMNQISEGVVGDNIVVNIESLIITHIINLSTNSINKVDNPPDTITINLPTLAANQTYAKVVLNITVGADVPQLRFPSNLKFTFNTDPNLFENCIATYEFETFDHGQIWLGKVYKYLNEPEKEVTETYIDDNFSWKTV